MSGLVLAYLVMILVSFSRFARPCTSRWPGDSRTTCHWDELIVPLLLQIPSLFLGGFVYLWWKRLVRYCFWRRRYAEAYTQETELNLMLEPGHLIEAEPKSFAQSRYKSLYSAVSLRGMNSYTVLRDMQDMIYLFAARHSIPRAQADAFLDRVLRRIPREADEGLDRVDASMQSRHRSDHHCGDPYARIRMALRVWTCDEKLEAGGAKVEICHILNEAIRRDTEPLLEPAVRLARAITWFCCNAQQHWPDGINSTTADTTYRGGGFPRQHMAWFNEPGKMFRSRQFLASSFLLPISRQFMFRQHDEPILWVFKFQRPCGHVSFIRTTEFEFLLVPYTVFTIEEATWQHAPTVSNPHRIVLRVASDNKAMPEDLPLAPWG
jgi:hypothetical protein